MISMTLAETAQAMSGKLLVFESASASIDSQAQVDSAVTDSRQVRPGSLFVAIKGERVDGHAYLEQAASAGAVAAVVDHEVAGAYLPQILVEDTVRALGFLARHNIEKRRSLAGQARTPFTIVGITGSVGKTTTKDLIRALLSPLGPTIAPQGSFNNEIGLPLTALQVGEETRFLVAEMGASAVGEIAYLTTIARPDLAVELKVGVAHLGGFGSVENIRQAKSELVRALPPSGLAILNENDENIRLMPEMTGVRNLLWFGLHEDRPDEDRSDESETAYPSVPSAMSAAEIYGDQVQVDDQDRPSFTVHFPDGTGCPMSLALPGRHNVMNALAAICVAYAMDLPTEAIAGILAHQGAQSPHRMDIRQVPFRPDSDLAFTLIDDSFNANPDSMKAGLDGLAAWHAESRTRDERPYRVAVLGSMLELGPNEKELHQRMGAYALSVADMVIAVGSEEEPHLDELAHDFVLGADHDQKEAGSIHWVHSAEQAADLVRGLEGEHRQTVVLLKGSHASGLQGLADYWLGQARK